MLSVLQRYLPYLLALFAGLVYLSTMAPTFSHTDSGELAAVQASLGIAHPTGYPLFTILGWLWLQLPIPGRPILLLNILCVLFVAGGTGLFAAALQKGLPDFKQDSKASEAGRLVSIAIGSLLLAFSHTYWMQSGAVEVYSLQILLLGLILLSLMKAWKAPETALRPWLWLALSLALGFANHLTTFLILPGIAWLFFRKHGFNKQSWSKLGLMLLVFFPLLTALYFYLPWRAGSEPTFNWGDPASWEAFWYHVRGKQFGIWLFESPAIARENFKEFWQHYPGEFAWVGFCLAVFGAIQLLRQSRELAIFSLITFAFTILFVINYSIADLETYFLLAYFITGIWMAWGAAEIWQWKMVSKLSPIIPSVGLLVLPLIALMYNYASSNQRSLSLYEDYSRAALSSLPPNSILITHQWDALVSGAWYLQQIEGFRSDVHIVEYMLMRDRPWYFHFMKNTQPALFQRLAPEIEAFDKELRAFTFGKRHSVQRLQKNFRALYLSIYNKNQDRPIYLAPEMVSSTLRENQLPIPNLVPEQYFFQVVDSLRSQQYIPLIPDREKLLFPEKQDMYIKQLRRSLSTMAQSRSSYEQYFGKEDLKQYWEQQARSFR